MLIGKHFLVTIILLICRLLDTRSLVVWTCLCICTLPQLLVNPRLTALAYLWLFIRFSEYQRETWSWTQITYQLQVMMWETGVVEFGQSLYRGSTLTVVPSQKNHSVGSYLLTNTNLPTGIGIGTSLHVKMMTFQVVDDENSILGMLNMFVSLLFCCFPLNFFCIGI